MDKLRCTSFSLFRSAFQAGEFCQMLVGHLLAVKKVFEVVCVCVCAHARVRVGNGRG